MREATEVREARPEYGGAEEAVPPGYKRTEVGVIPEEWEVRRVDEIGSVLAGKALAVNAAGVPRPYLRTANVFDGRIDVDDVLSMPMTDAEFERFRVQADDVLLNEGQSRELVGRCAMYRGELGQPCGMQNQLLRFRPYAGCSGDFATQLFRHCQASGIFAKIALQTTSIAHLGASRFSALRVVVPPLPEQRAIAGALSDVDDLISALDKLIEKKRAIKQATMQQLLTGLTRLPGFGGEWKTVTVGEIVQPSTRRIDPRFENRSRFCIELEHVESRTGRLIGHTTTTPHSSIKAVFEEGDVLFGKLRAYLRKYWQASEPGVCSTEFWVLRPSQAVADSTYLSQLVRTDWFVEGASMSYGTHMPRSDWRVVSGLELNLPPLPEQRAIAAVLSDIDAEIEALERRREKTRLIKQGMMQELLTGRIRLLEASKQEAGAE